MTDIIIDTFLDDNIRLYIEYNYSHNKYEIVYVNPRYNYNLINDSSLYNEVYDWYLKISNNFSIIRNLNEQDFLSWLIN